MEWLLTLTVCWHLAAVLLYTSDCLPAKLVIYLSQKNNVFESWSSVQCWPSVVLQKKNYPTVLQIIWAICKYYPFCGMCMGSKSPRKLSLRGKWSGIGFLGFPRLYGFWACCLQCRRHLGQKLTWIKQPVGPGAHESLSDRGTICHTSDVPQQPPM